MRTSTNNFNTWGLWPQQKANYNAVLDVQLSDQGAAAGGGAQILNDTVQGATYQNDSLINAVIYLLFLDGVQWTQIPDVEFSDPPQKEFKLDAETGIITFAFSIDDPVAETIFYTSPGTIGLPGAEPVTLQEAKDYMKVDTGTIDDQIITDLIITAREQVEDYTGISIIHRSVTAVIKNTNGGIYLPYCPFISMLSIVDADGNTIDTDDYTLSGELFKQLIDPHDDRMTLTYTAGYGIPPQKFITAIKQQVFFLYQNRGENPFIYRGVETDLTMSPQAKATLQRLRRVSWT